MSHAPPSLPCHVVLLYLNFRADGFSHDGLGVNAGHTVRVLRKHGVFAEARCVRSVADIRAYLGAHPTLTHAMIEAPWVSPLDLSALIHAFPRVAFSCRMHAQISFLQVDNNAIKYLRGYQMIQDGDVGFHIAANNKRFVQWFVASWNSYCAWLPNLYDMDRPARKRPTPHDHRLLRIGSFGALRPMKNHLTAAAAAMQIARQRGCDLEFWVSTGRDEQHGVLRGIRNLFAAHPWAQVVGNPWQPWAEFRHTVARMDLVIQASYTESFNIVTADAVAEGIPVVVAPCVEWLPRPFQADSDDAAEIARTGSLLLNDPHIGSEAVAALESHVGNGVRLWLDFFRRTAIVGI